MHLMQDTAEEEGENFCSPELAAYMSFCFACCIQKILSEYSDFHMTSFL